MQSFSLLRMLSPLLLFVGCVYTGTARKFDPRLLEKESGWISVPEVPLVIQEGPEDCGPASLSMVISYWGIPVTEAEVMESCPLAQEKGARARDLRDFARAKGLQAFLFHGTLNDLQTELQKRRPLIVGLIKPLGNGAVSHYQVVVAMHPEKQAIVSLDPAQGWQWDSFEGFSKEWGMAGNPILVFFPAAMQAPAISQNRKVSP